VRKRIVFVINSIGFGGAERALVNLLDAAGARRDQYDVHLVLLDDDPEMRETPAWPTKHVLDSRGSLLRTLRLLTPLLVRLRPALVVSFLVRANVATALAARWIGFPAIVCERMHLSSHLAGRYRGAVLWATRLAPRMAYRSARAVLGVSTGVTEDLVRNFGVSPDRAQTIFNPYDLEAIRRDAVQPPEIALPDRFIVAVGRLEPSKNFGQLIEAFIEARLPMSLVILGEGSERSALEAAVAKAGAQERILLPGYVRNPFAIVARAEFFAASSRNEGFPNAMVEAMVLGKPVVATDCPSGPAEILAGVVSLDSAVPVDAAYGVLVPEGSVAALAEGLTRMADPARARLYAGRAAERASAFDRGVVAERYWALFDAVAASSDRS
jgi:glycosyltransferase involved in cell wall biosynthesis